MGVLPSGSLVRAALPLYGLAAVQALAPLLTLPLLARRLGPDAFGWVFTAQSLAGWAAIVIEYGFTYSAARRASALRDDPAAVARIVAEVASARAVLSGVACVVLALAYLLVPAWRDLPGLLWAGAAVLMLAQGNAFLWCLQGVEAASRAVPVALASRVLVWLAVWASVQDAGDAAVALGILAGGAVLETAGQAWRLRSLIGPWRMGWGRQRWARIGEDLREGRLLAMNRLVYAGLTSGNVALMAAMTSPGLTGSFAAAERLVGYAIQGLAPVSTALFVRASHRVHQDPARAARQAQRDAPRLVGLMAALALALSFGAPVVGPWVLGREFGAVVPVLAWLAWIMPLHAVHYALGPGWLVARHLDRVYARCVAAAAVTNLVGAALLAPRWGGVGMAWSLLASLTVLAGGLVGASLRDWRSLAKEPPGAPSE